MNRGQVLGLWGGLALVLVVVNVAAAGKERVRRDGQRVLLELAPVDPRSLMQGDYMRLTLAIAAELRRESWDGADEAGLIVLRRDADGVGRYARVATPGEALGRDELFLQYRRAGDRITVGPDAFLFEEGEAARYARARYADVRVSADGEAVLVGLRDRDRKPLK